MADIFLPVMPCSRYEPILYPPAVLLMCNRALTTVAVPAVFAAYMESMLSNTAQQCGSLLCQRQIGTFSTNDLSVVASHCKQRWKLRLSLHALYLVLQQRVRSVGNPRRLKPWVSRFWQQGQDVTEART